MKLYELADEMRALNDMLENEDFDPVTGEVFNNDELIQKMFSELTLNFGDKLDGSAYVVQTLELQSKALKDEAKRLAERAKRLENNADTLKGMMLSALLNIEGNKLKTAKFTFGTRKSESVQIEEDFNYKNADYVRIKTVYEPDKNKIKDAIKAGETVLGVSLVTNKSLSIR